MMVLMGIVENNCCPARKSLYKRQHLWIDPAHYSTDRMLGYIAVPHRE